MPEYKVLRAGLTLGSADAVEGDTLPLDSRYAEPLVRLGYLAALEGEKEPEGGQDPEGEQEPDGTVTTLPGVDATNNAGEPSGEAAQDAQNELIAKIDAKYKKPQLAEKAKELGVDFAFDATKEEIITAVLAAGKAAELL